MVPATGRAPTLVHPPRWRLLLLAASCVVFAAIGTVPLHAEHPFYVTVGALGVAVFALGAALLMWRALRPGPTVVIDAEGITDRTTLAPLGLVRWEEIAAVRQREIGRGRGREPLLELVLADPDRFRARPASPLRRLVHRYRELVSQPYVHIPGSMVSMPLPELIARLRSWRPDLLVMEPPPAPPRRSRLGRWLSRERRAGGRAGRPW